MCWDKKSISLFLKVCSDEEMLEVDSRAEVKVQ